MEANVIGNPDSQIWKLLGIEVEEEDCEKGNNQQENHKGDKQNIEEEWRKRD